MADDGAVTHWIHQLKAGDAVAVQKVWEKYYRRLIALAHKKLGGNRRAADEEDVVQKAFATFCRRAKEGRFPQLDDRDDLLRLLLVITARKAINQAVKEGRGKVRGDSALRHPTAADSGDGWEAVIGTEPTPEYAAQTAEELQRLMGLLPDDEARSIAQMKMEGCTNDEIAAHLGCSRPTVERRLRRVIRPAWRAELGKVTAGDISSPM